MVRGARVARHVLLVLDRLIVRHHHLLVLVRSSVHVADPVDAGPDVGLNLQQQLLEVDELTTPLVRLNCPEDLQAAVHEPGCAQVVEPSPVERREQALRVLIHEGEQVKDALATSATATWGQAVVFEALDEEAGSAQGKSEFSHLVVFPKNWQINLAHAAWEHAEQAEQVQRFGAGLSQVKRRGVHTDFERLGRVQSLHAGREILRINHLKQHFVQVGKSAIVLEEGSV